ncbi:transcriptional regulator, partial [Streptomyces albidoflavus]|nr:transcriptional regulator [Streptomyces albidoflavus]
ELAARDAGNPEAARVVVVTAALPVAGHPDSPRAEESTGADAGPAQDGETP